MNILFTSNIFPDIFANLIEFASQKGDKVYFLTNQNINTHLDNVKKFIAPKKYDIPDECHPYLATYTYQLNNALEILEQAKILKRQGLKPDIIIDSASSGCGFFLKKLYKKTPIISYLDYYHHAEADLDIDTKANIRCTNTGNLFNLIYTDFAFTHTNWQKQTYPKEFQNKIKVFKYWTDENQQSNSDEISINGKTLTTKDNVITYFANPYNAQEGFENCLQIIKETQSLTNDINFVIVGLNIQGNIGVDMEKVHIIPDISQQEKFNLLKITKGIIYPENEYPILPEIYDGLANNCQIFAYKTTPAKEILSEENFCHLFEYGDYEGFCKTLLETIKNDKKSSDFAKQNQKNIKTFYDYIKEIYTTGENN